jgi:hypothetical protein
MTAISQNMQLGALHAPGSAAAIATGCQCPCYDNRHGAGLFRHDGITYYVMSVDCPLHGHLVENEGQGDFGWPNLEETNRGN